jgi:HK97 family phage major capsid protein
MNYLQQLRERRDAAVARARVPFDAARGDGTNSRAMTPDEATTYNTAMDEVRSLATQILQAEEQERLDAETAGRTQPINTHTTTEARDLAKYSILKAVRSALPANKGGVELSGIEKEMHQQAVNEARAAGKSVEGVGIPQMLLERRDNSITQPTQPEDGSAVIERSPLRPVIDLLRPRTPLRALGAQFLTGLTGNVPVPTMTQGAVATWKGEIDELDKSNQKFSSTEMTPHRLGTFAIRSLQFLAQTAPSVETMLRTDIENAMMQALELAAINGSGSNGEPLGILNTSGVNVFDTGANGTAPSRALLVGLQALVEDQNVRMDSPGFLINVLTKATLLNTKIDAGSGLFLMGDAGTLLGEQVGVTSLMPKNLTKGTGTNLSAAVYGNWRDLLIGQWGGLDITVDPYTLATKGQVRIIIQSFFDVLVQRPKAFAVAKGISASIPQA